METSNDRWLAAARTIAAGASIVLLLAWLAGAALAAEGDLDPGFNGGQPVVVSAGPTGSSTKLTAVAKQADGKVVAVGNTDSGNGSGSGAWVIERFLTNGHLDPGFGTGGVVSLILGATASTSAVVVQPSDQRILVGGVVYSGGVLGAEFVRVKTDGSLDGSFGGTGMVFLSQSGLSVISTGGIALDSAGRAYLAGGGLEGSSSVGLIASVTSGGAANGWGAGGILLPDTSSAGPRVQLSSVAVSGGTVFYAGTARDSSPQLNPSALIGAVSGSDGSAVAGFGTGGLFKLSQGTAFNGLLLAADGKLKATGFGTGTGPGTGALVASFNTSGANPTDTGFGSGGEVIVGGAANQPNNGNAISEAGGKLFAATTAVLSNSTTQPALVGLDETTGALDTGLGSGGFRLYSFGATSYSTGIADPNGDVVISGVVDQTQGGSDQGFLAALQGVTGGGGTAPCAPVTLEAFKSVSLFKRDPYPSPSDRVTVGRGEMFAYRIDIENIGKCAAKDVILGDVLPGSFRASTNATGKNAAYALLYHPGQENFQTVKATGHLEPGNTLTLALGDLAPGDRFVVLIPGSTASLTRETNTVTVNAVGVHIDSNESRVIVTRVPQSRNTQVNASQASGKALTSAMRAADAAAANPVARLSRLAYVDVAVQSLPRRHLRAGGTCRWLDKRGLLKRLKAGPNGACNAPVWLRARGTTRWLYRFKPKLPRGKYELLVRVVNRGGVYDTNFSPAHHNRVRFAVS